MIVVYEDGDIFIDFSIHQFPPKLIPLKTVDFKRANGSG